MKHYPKLLFGFLFTFVSVALFGQNIIVKPSSPVQGKFDSQHEKYLGQLGDELYVLESRAKLNDKSLNRWFPVLRVLNLRTMKEVRSLSFPELVNRTANRKDYFIDAVMIKDHIALLVCHNKAKEFLLQWIDAKTLKLTGQEAKVSGFEEGYDAINFHDYNSGFSLIVSPDEEMLAVVATKSNRNSIPRFLITLFNQKREIAYQKEIEHEIKFNYKFLMNNGSIVMFGRNSVESNGFKGLTYVSEYNYTSFKYMEIDPSGSITSEKEIDNELQGFGSSIHVTRLRNSQFYFAGISPDDFGSILTGTMDFENGADYQFNITKFTPEMHAQLKDDDFSEKDLEKAKNGKSFIPDHFSYDAMAIAANGDFILTASVIERTQTTYSSGYSATKVKAGQVLIARLNQQGEILWSKVVHQKNAVSGSFSIFLASASFEFNGKVILFINNRPQELKGFELKGDQLGRIAMVSIDEDGTWSKAPVELPGKHSGHVLKGISVLILENNFLVPGSDKGHLCDDYFMFTLRG